MTPTQEVDYILHDCFLAVGQAIGSAKQVEFETIRWWRRRYRGAFLQAMERGGNSWLRERHRVTAVGRFLGQRALHHAGEQRTIDIRCAALASAEVETGCRMKAEADARE